MKLKKNKLFFIEISALIALVAVAAVLAVAGLIKVNGKAPSYTFEGEHLFARNVEAEENSEDNSIFTAVFESEGIILTAEYTEEEWEALEDDCSVTGYVYVLEDGNTLAFIAPADDVAVNKAYREILADENRGLFDIALAIFFIALGLAVITFFADFFSTYEKIWFLTILVAASLVSILMPEESVNGINGIWIMLLYLADTFLNILCELLISKQSKWNFIVSLFVEITEVLMCIVLAYRFATLATTLIFWLPIDIVSFVNWHRHPDENSEELTVVRKLSGIGAVLVIMGIVLWTVGIGYLLSGLDITTDLFGGNEILENIVCYLDACASAVGIANGVFILLRYREQWIAWYISALLESVINIVSGQFVLLVLKFGYITNTTYGYIKWTKYIKSKKEKKTA